MSMHILAFPVDRMELTINCWEVTAHFHKKKLGKKAWLIHKQIYWTNGNIQDAHLCTKSTSARVELA